MKHFNQNTLKRVFVSSLFTATICNAAQAQTCTVTASGNNINVNAGEVVCVSSNISGANVNIASGGTLKVDQGYTLTVQNMNDVRGAIVNNGTLVMGSMSFANGGSLLNNGQTTFNGTPNFNGTASITNSQGGKLTFNATFSLQQNSTLTNSGTLISESGDVSANNGTTITNSGRFEIKTGNFNPGGVFVNNGVFSVVPFININGGTIRNNCRFIVANGFNNSATFINDGLVWVTKADGRVQLNSGSFTNTYRGKLRVHEFTNNATVSGSGEFYVTGTSRQQGTFAGATSHPDSTIKFYDASLSNPQVTGSYFDFGIQGANVVRPASMTAPDTSGYNGSCTQQTFDLGGFTPLPLDLLGFTAKAINNDVQLDWETANEKSTRRFAVEYSTDGSSWKEIGTVAASGYSAYNRYAFTHYQVSNVLNMYRIRMEDMDGTTTYSPVKSVSIASGRTAEAQVYPNPTQGKVTLKYNNEGTGDLQLTLTDIAGRQVQQQRLAVAEGVHSFDLDLSSLPKGIYILSLKDASSNTLLSHKKIVRN